MNPTNSNQSADITLAQDPEKSELNKNEVLLNRSLERGVEILRAYRPGTGALRNSDLAERTGLPHATVSRLTQTLISGGFLEHDSVTRGYRLATPLLSHAHAMYQGSTVLQAAVPLMREYSERLQINVGLATEDREEMVYLEVLRHNPTVTLRNSVSGHRVPIELTSLGRASLAVAPEK